MERSLATKYWLKEKKQRRNRTVMKEKEKNSLSTEMNWTGPMNGSVKPSSITGVYQPEFSTVTLINVRLD